MVGPYSPGSPGSPGRKIHRNFRTGRARRGRKARPDGKITESPRQKRPAGRQNHRIPHILYTYFTEAIEVALWLTMLPCAVSRGRFGDAWMSMTVSFGSEAEGAARAKQQPKHLRATTSIYLASEPRSKVCDAAHHHGPRGALVGDSSAPRRSHSQRTQLDRAPERVVYGSGMSRRQRRRSNPCAPGQRAIVPVNPARRPTGVSSEAAPHRPRPPCWAAWATSQKSRTRTVAAPPASSQSRGTHRG
eukprot:scaffold8760_cov116-Isochrysis_galbana.AAC.16